MEINIEKEYSKALDSKIDIRIGNDDPTLTYQEFFLYWVLYTEFSGQNKVLDSEKMYTNYKNSWIQTQWFKCQASKYSKIEITKKWDEVF